MHMVAPQRRYSALGEGRSCEESAPRLCGRGRILRRRVVYVLPCSCSVQGACGGKLRLAKEEFKYPPLITDEEIEDVLGEIPELIKWANAILAYATDAAVNHGKAWMGFKIVEGRSVRRYKDEDAVAREAKAAGYTDIFDKRLIPLTQMEKLMGKEVFAKTLGDLIEKPPGKPTLVPVSDKRPAIHTGSAQSEFTAITEVH